MAINLTKYQDVKTEPAVDVPTINPPLPTEVASLPIRVGSAGIEVSTKKELPSDTSIQVNQALSEVFLNGNAGLAGKIPLSNIELVDVHGSMGRPRGTYIEGTASDGTPLSLPVQIENNNIVSIKNTTLEQPIGLPR
jgi:hypothetical protein